MSTVAEARAQFEPLTEVWIAQSRSPARSREWLYLGEPATPFGIGGFVWALDNLFSFRDAFSGEETDFGSHNTPSLRFLQR